MVTTRRLLRSALPVLALTICAATFAPQAPAARTYWFETYQKAVELIEDGDCAQASGLLDGLIRNRPQPELAVRIPGNQYIDYVPYYQRARAQLDLGQIQDAAQSLDLSFRYGAITQTRRHARQVEKLSDAIRSAPADQPVAWTATTAVLTNYGPLESHGPLG